MRNALRAAAVVLLAGFPLAGCAYFNTLYNAKQKFAEAQELKRRADPEREKISPTEETLYSESFEKAAKVVKYYPDSKWVDDALLLMGRSSLEKGDYSTALRKFDEILQFYPDSDLTAETLLMTGRTLIETRDFEAGAEALSRASEIGGKDVQDDIAYFLGRSHQDQGNREEALAAFAEVVSRHRKSEWFDDAGIRAGQISEEQGDLTQAVSFYEKVRADGRTMEERFRAGMLKGEALLRLEEYGRAGTTFHDAGKRTLDGRDRGRAVVEKGKAILAGGDVEGAMAIFQEILVDYERKEPAADAQLAIAQIHDEAGDLETALEQYDLVKDQGTGFAAWQEASTRKAEIQRVLDLRQAIEGEEQEERDRNRFLLAEQLLEKIGDVDGALAEYARLAEDSPDSEWGGRALFAKAWVLEHRLEQPEAADSVFFQLANFHRGSEVSAAARRRLGYPVWTVEVLDPPPVKFIRPEGADEPEDVVLSRVDPAAVPLPEGVDSKTVWVRVQVNDDGTARKATVTKSGGDAFDDAALEAAEASGFLSPSAGGPEYTVLQYTFPPPAAAPADPGTTPVETPAEVPVIDDEPSAADRDAMLDAMDAGSGKLVSPLVPDSSAVKPDSSAVAPDSAAARTETPLQPGAVRIRDRRIGGSGDD